MTNPAPSRGTIVANWPFDVRTIGSDPSAGGTQIDDQTPAPGALGPDVLAALPIERWPRRELILLHAARLFAVRGYHGTSTREIAAAVGVRQPSLFHHFPSKLAIVEALLAFDLDLPHAYARTLREGPGSAAVRLYRYVLWDIAYCVRSPFDLRGLHGADIVEDPALATWKRKVDGYHADLRHVIEQGVQAGELVCDDPELARQAITGITLETVRQHGGGAATDGRGRPDRAASFALRALLARPDELGEVRRAAHAARGAPWPLDSASELWYTLPIDR